MITDTVEFHKYFFLFLQTRSKSCPFLESTLCVGFMILYDFMLMSFRLNAFLFQCKLISILLWYMYISALT